MRNENFITWEEIYKLWKSICEYSYDDLLEKVNVIKIPIESSKLPSGQFMKGYDWIRNNYLKTRIKYVTESPIEFLLFGEKCNKGTLTTAEYLDKAGEDLDLLSAIWIYAASKDVLDRLPDKWRGDMYRVLYSIHSEAAQVLRDRDMTWHFAMKKMLPEKILSYPFVDSIRPEDDMRLHVVLEILAVNSLLIFREYTLVYYYTVKEDGSIVT